MAGQLAEQLRPLAARLHASRAIGRAIVQVEADLGAAPKSGDMVDQNPFRLTISSVAQVRSTLSG